ncbi:hypothetical protein BD560DRAFT_441174 [Blakeslea trispora]|nr:hypothetical protein BD560DRAFT_441174 [Blakeslea trispora]
MLSRSQLKMILYGIGKIVEIAVEETQAERAFVIPTANMIMRGAANKKFDGPSIITTTTSHTVMVKEKKQVSTCSSNLPLEHLKLSMANPVICTKINRSPDRTRRVSTSLATGEKWRMHSAFQPPCITSNGKDFWVGDVALLRETNQAFLFKSFFQQDNQDFADRYFVMTSNGFSGIIPQVNNVQQNALIGTVDKRSFTRSNSCTLGLGSNSLSKEHEDLLWKQDSTKREKQNEPATCTLRKLVDDLRRTTFEERGSREKTMFVGCAPKSDGVNAMNFIPCGDLSTFKSQQ